MWSDKKCRSLQLFLHVFTTQPQKRTLLYGTLLAFEFYKHLNLKNIS